MTNKKTLILIALVASFSAHLKAAGTTREYITDLVFPSKTQTVEIHNQVAVVVQALQGTEIDEAYAMQDPEVLSAMPEDKTYSEMAYDAGKTTWSYAWPAAKCVAKGTWYGLSYFGSTLDNKYVSASYGVTCAALTCYSPVIGCTVGVSVLLATMFPTYSAS